MAFPVIATVKFCFTRIPRDWDIIWRYLQIPFLLCCLFGCVMLGIYVLAGPETFIRTEIVAERETTLPTAWYFVYLLSAGWVPSIFFLPFLISFGRFALVGVRGLEGRHTWSWGQAEWHFVKGMFFLIIICLGYLLAFTLVAGAAFLASSMLVSVIAPSEPILALLKLVGGAILVIAFLFLISQLLRLSVVYIPLSFQAPFKSDSLWAATRGMVWRYFGCLALIGLVVVALTWVITFGLESLLFGGDPAAQLKMQMLQSIFLLPITAISVPAINTLYAEVWRYSGGHEEWSGAGEQIAQPAAETTPAQ
jgi:hypothetical protein